MIFIFLIKYGLWLELFGAKTEPGDISLLLLQSGVTHQFTQRTAIRKIEI